MKNFFKKILTLGLCLSLVASLFAEPASTGITDSDVKNYAKNLNSIVKELQAIGVWSDDSINATVKQKTTVDSVLQKYGISGANCIDKFGMITSCAVVIVSASELDAESAALLKSFGLDPMAELKKNVNSKDYSVVEANSKAVVKAYKELDTSSFDVAETSSSDDYMTGMDDYYSKLADAFAQQAAESDDDSAEFEDEIKTLYELVSKAKGDSGLIYKKKKSASKYKKTNPKKGAVITVEHGYGNNSLNWSFDLDKKKAQLDFTWGKKNKKKIAYTITSVEYYYLKVDSDSGGESKEYVIATKEGPVFHFYDEWSFDGNAFEKQIATKGLSRNSIVDENAIFWTDTLE